MSFEKMTYQKQHAKAVNDLARAKFKEKLLLDIVVDLTICEIEGWSKVDYLNELKDLINNLGKGELK